MELILEGMASAVSLVTILIYAVAILAAIFGIAFPIRQRRKEKARGEEEEAKKY